MSENPRPDHQTDGPVPEPVEVPTRSFTEYAAEQDLAFDPLKDLNLPGSYDEVVARFEKLQEERGGIELN
jgi:hypothetical protein